MKTHPLRNLSPAELRKLSSKVLQATVSSSFIVAWKSFCRPRATVFIWIYLSLGRQNTPATLWRLLDAAICMQPKWPHLLKVCSYPWHEETRLKRLIYEHSSLLILTWKSFWCPRATVFIWIYLSLGGQNTPATLWRPLDAAICMQPNWPHLLNVCSYSLH